MIDPADKEADNTIGELVVVPTPANCTAYCSHDPKHGAYSDEQHSERPENRHRKNESNQHQDNTKCDHNSPNSFLNDTILRFALQEENGCTLHFVSSSARGSRTLSGK
jgi:hypothetical protein